MRIAVTTDDRLVAISGERAYHLGAALGLAAGPDPLLRHLDAGGAAALTSIDLSTMDSESATGLALGPPLRRPHKIIGAPVNYRNHQVEMAEQQTIAEYGVFLKATSSVIGPSELIRLPYRDRRTDQEGELGVVIGARARDVPAERALAHVFGYTCVLDITVRSTEDRSTRKSYDTFTPIGPWIVTADEVGDPGMLGLRCWVDGELRQDTRTSELIYSVPELVSYASHVMTLEPGDVIATGTPAGVGPIHAGARVAVEIDRIGRLEVGVTDEGAIAYADRPGPR